MATLNATQLNSGVQQAPLSFKGDRKSLPDYRGEVDSAFVGPSGEPLAWHSPKQDSADKANSLPAKQSSIREVA